MAELTLALYAEGTTDDVFLPLIIQRTSKMILAQYGQNRVQVVQLAIVNQTLRPRQKIELSSLYEPLGKKIRLEKLAQLPSYIQFVHDLTQVLQQLHYIV